MGENLSIDLDRILSRLSDTLLSPTADDTHLRTTAYERNRMSQNIEYARTLVLTLEHNTKDIKTATRKQSLQSHLQDQRDLIKRLNQRLVELNQLSYTAENNTDNDSSSDEEEEEQEGVIGVKEFAPAVPTSDTLDTDPSAAAPPPSQDNGLRARKTIINPNAPADAATTSALFGTRTAANPSVTNPKPTDTTAILEDGNREQDLLTTSLVALAQSLKQSSQQFASSLESEKEVLRRAESGLDKNSMGMEAAGNKMGALRRMTEGQGWWGRIKLYAIIAALWIAAFLLVFVGPKLRF